MNKSFLHAEDWAPIHAGFHNHCWLQIVRIIDEFEQLLETEKHQIKECIRELSLRRIELIKKFEKYKSSLKYQGEVKQENLAIYDSEKAKYFFVGYYGQIQQIMTKIAARPATLAKMLAEFRHRQFENADFEESILYHLYPCYMPPVVESGRPNHCLAFVEEVINQWSYSVELGRPREDNIIDHIIAGFNKTPEIVCYIEKISVIFMKQISKCKMDFFAFDENSIRHQFQFKRSQAMSQTSQAKSKMQAFKNFFKRKQADITSQSVTSEASEVSQLDYNVEDIMRMRQKDFMTVVMKTIMAIIKEDQPFLLKQMMRFFDNKIRKDMQSRTEKSTIKVVGNATEPKDAFEKKKVSSTRQTCSSEEGEGEGEKQYYRHYCYFLFTNLICQQLHSKFTLSHQDTDMKPADIQNITEIIKIITQVFQGEMPRNDKYKHEKLHELSACIPKIPVFYQKILQRSDHQNAELQQELDNIFDNQQDLKKARQIRETLLCLHENTLVLSFNDIRQLLQIVKNSSFKKQLQLSPRTETMEFLEDSAIKTIYAPATKRVTFNNAKVDIEKIFFVFNSSTPSDKQVIEYYIGSESPLKELPILTNSLIHGSNLSLPEALQVTKSLQLMQNLSFKETKYFLNKIMLRYNNLHLRDSEMLAGKFRETIEKNLNRNIIRKSVLLLHRDEIWSRIRMTQKTIDYYTEELRSSQFYDRITEVFINNIKVNIILRIENDELRIYTNLNEVNKIQSLNAILVASTEGKQKQMGEQFLLRTSCKVYSSIPELLATIARCNITVLALSEGKKNEEFNIMFNKLCSIILSHVQDFMNKREVLKNLNKEKLGTTIVSKIQNNIFDSYYDKHFKLKLNGGLKNDRRLEQSKKLVDAQAFKIKQIQSLKDLKVDFEFLLEQGKDKFKLMIEQKSIMDKLTHFEQMFTMIFTVLRFRTAEEKISADVINPITQYLILISPGGRHYECLHCLKSLKWNTKPDTDYKIMLYQSSLAFIMEDMPKQFPLQPNNN